MALTTNFDELNRLHKAAIVGGSNSRAWIEFASTMMDSFPALYKTAQAMNARLAEIEQRISDIRKGH